MSKWLIRLKLLKRLEALPHAHWDIDAVLLQVNAGEDQLKFGVSVEETPRFAFASFECEGLQVDGFMTIALCP